MRSPLLLLPLALLLVGCWMPTSYGGTYGARGHCPMTCPPASRALDPERAHALYDGASGRPIALSEFLARARSADVVAFGELHDHPVGATYERLVLQSLATGPRPVALAMEFFEADHQEALDAYLAGEMDLEALRKATRRGPTYDETHGPLVEFAKARGIPVIAANAPRRLVSGYRRSGEPYYEDYLASLTDEERSWLPAETSMIQDAYWERFAELMGGDRAKPFFRAQSLWDDAMAESMALFRDAHPGHRILFIVGGFHVTEKLGTITKYLQRRPNDRIALLLMNAGDDPHLAFEEEDRGMADAVLKVRLPKREAPAMPNPHAAPPTKKPAAKEPDAPPRPQP